MSIIFPFHIDKNTTKKVSLDMDTEVYLRGRIHLKVPFSLPSYLQEETSETHRVTEKIVALQPKNEANEIIQLFEKTDDEIIKLLKSSMHKNTLFLKK